MRKATILFSMFFAWLSSALIFNALLRAAEVQPSIFWAQIVGIGFAILVGEIFS